MEHATLEPLFGEFGEEALDGVQPGRRSRREVEGEAWMAAEPVDHLGMLVGGVVVQDHMDQLARRDLALNGVEETDELLVAMTLHAASDDTALRHVQGGKQRGGAVSLVVMRHRAAASALQRQPGLGAIERLDLALLVHREHHGVRWRIDVEADDIAQLGAKFGSLDSLNWRSRCG